MERGNEGERERARKGEKDRESAGEREGGRERQGEGEVGRGLESGKEGINWIGEISITLMNIPWWDRQ